jgi:arylsulfatase
MDNGSPVSEAYEPPFVYSGTIKKVEIKIQDRTLSASDQQAVRDMERVAALTIE